MPNQRSQLWIQVNARQWLFIPSPLRNRLIRHHHPPLSRPDTHSILEMVLVPYHKTERDFSKPRPSYSPNQGGEDIMRRFRRLRDSELAAE